MTINQFLTWLATSGGYGAVVAFVLERIPKFTAIKSAGTKGWIVLGCSLVVALASWAVLTYVPTAVLAQAEPPFLVISGVVGTWLATQVAHTVDPAA
jgi:hypothetical protein